MTTPISEATATLRTLPLQDGPASLTITYFGSTRAFTRTLTLEESDQKKVNELFKQVKNSFGSGKEISRINLQTIWIQTPDGLLEGVETLKPEQLKIIESIRTIFDKALKEEKGRPLARPTFSKYARSDAINTLPHPFTNLSERTGGLRKKESPIQDRINAIPDEAQKKRVKNDLTYLQTILKKIYEKSKSLKETSQQKQPASAEEAKKLKKDVEGLAEWIVQLENLDLFALYYATTIEQPPRNETPDGREARLQAEITKLTDLIAKETPGTDGPKEPGIFNSLKHHFLVKSREKKLTEEEIRYAKDVVLLTVTDRKTYYTVSQQLLRMTNDPLEWALLRSVQEKSADWLINHPLAARGLSDEAKAELTKALVDAY